MAEVLDQSKERERNLQRELSQTEDKTALGALESAIAEVEEDQDVQAAKTARAEAVADLAEFDENIPVDDCDNDNAELSKAEIEVQSLVSQVSIFTFCDAQIIIYVTGFSYPVSTHWFSR